MTHIAGTVDPVAYRQRLRELLDQVGALDRDAQNGTAALLTELAEQVNDTIANASTLTGAMYQQTLANLTAATNTFASRYGRNLTEWTQLAAQLGAELAADPLAAAGATAVTVGSGITQNLLDTITGFSVDLVQNITQDLNLRIRREVAAAAIGAQTPFDAAKAIGRNLRDPNHFRTVNARAQAIATTEIGRAQALATQVTQEQLATQLADSDHTLRKRWINAHLPGARPSHLETEARYHPDGTTGPIKIDETFRVGNYRALYPRDPALPASESVNCHCVSISVFLEHGLGIEDSTPVDLPPQPAKAPRRPSVFDQDYPGVFAANEAARGEIARRHDWLAANPEWVKPAGWDGWTKRRKQTWLETTAEDQWPGIVTVRAGGDPLSGERVWRLRKPVFNLEGTDPDLMFNLVGRLRQHAIDWPAVAERMDFVGTYRGEKGAAARGVLSRFRRTFRWGPNTYAHATNDGRQLGLNPKWYGNPDMYLEAITRDHAHGFHPLGTDHVFSVIDHEWGHHVENWVNATFRDGIGLPDAPTALIRATGAGSLQDLWGLLTEPVRRGVPLNRRFPQRTLALWRNTPGEIWDGRVSTYGHNNQREGFAEAFALWRNTPGEPGRKVFSDLAERGAHSAAAGDAPRYWQAAQREAMDAFDSAMLLARKVDAGDIISAPLVDWRHATPTDRGQWARAWNAFLDDLEGGKTLDPDAAGNPAGPSLFDTYLPSYRQDLESLTDVGAIE